MDLDLDEATDVARSSVPSGDEPRGDEPTDPFERVPERLRGALRARGFDELTAVQLAVLEEAAEGRDLQVSSQTGSGKTVALGFVIAPSLEGPRESDGPDALIVVPTRELATQVSGELEWLFAGLDVRVGSVTGGTPLFRDRQLLSHGPRVLVGTPGRLLDHVRSGALELGGVRELVLDEADQMLDMGFREELEGILDATPQERRTHLVSATFPDGIQRLAARYQRDALAIEGTRLGEANEDIEHEGYLVRGPERYATLVNLLLLADDDRTLVFVERRADALELAEKLEQEGFLAAPLSGELVQSQRARTLAAFRDGRISVLVATDVAARGLDVPDVATVIHTAPCIDGEVYTHRSGRTGRAGNRGRSVLLAPPGRRRKVERLLRDAGVELEWLPAPRPADVREALARRERDALDAELLAALAEPAPAHLAHAVELLAGHEPAALVAALLARLKPARRIDAREMPPRDEADEAERPQRGPRPERRDRADRRDRGDRGDRPAGKPPRYDARREDQGSWRPERSRGPRDFRDDGAGRGGSGRPRPGGFAREPGRPGPLDTVRFFMNYGANQGATPGRVLAAVCRRGGVNGEHVGSIAVHPNASTFDVTADVATRFERAASRRDKRDPQTIIRRDRGPQPGGGPVRRRS